MNNLLLLFIEFFKTGLFTFGGGWASLPFLYAMVDNYNWFSSEQLTNLIAISAITPGPVGLNMSTFAGFITEGLFGAIISTLALVLPMIVISCIVFNLFKKLSNNKYVKSILYLLRPASVALICSVGIKLLFDLIIFKQDFHGLILLFILFIMTFHFSRNPIIYLLVGAITGLLFNVMVKI